MLDENDRGRLAPRKTTPEEEALLALAPLRRVPWEREPAPELLALARSCREACGALDDTIFAALGTLCIGEAVQRREHRPDLAEHPQVGEPGGPLPVTELLQL